MKVRLTSRARDDLRQIREHYLSLSEATAERVRVSIDEAIEMVAVRPSIGPPNRLVPGMRSKLVLRYPFRVHYRIRSGLLEVIHIRHTARRPWPEKPE